MSGSDESDSKDPLPPSNFLTAVGKLNPMFEGNQQQDAHEMLGYIINLLQEIKIPAAAISGEALQICFVIPCTSSSTDSAAKKTCFFSLLKFQGVFYGLRLPFPAPNTLDSKKETFGLHKCNLLELQFDNQTKDKQVP